MIVPLVDRLNHVGEFVKGLEPHSSEPEISEALAGISDSLCKAMVKVSKRENLPFTESTFRNFIKRFPAFNHKVTEDEDDKTVSIDSTDEQTTKLMSWLKL